MDVEALIAAFMAGGIQLRVEGGVLRWRARAGVMTAELREALELHRAVLTARLSRLPERVADWPSEQRELYEERAGFGEYVGGMTRDEAERTAEALVRLRVAANADEIVCPLGSTPENRESSLRVRESTPQSGGSRSIR